MSPPVSPAFAAGPALAGRHSLADGQHRRRHLPRVRGDRRPVMRPGLAFACLGLAVAALTVVLSSSFSFAATLGVSSQKITVSTALAPAERTCTLTASAADATIDQTLPTTNFGTSPDLLVRSSSGANRRSLVRFDLSSCGLPQDAQIVSATLELFLKARAGSPNRDYRAARLLATWGENTVTWNNQPAAATTPTAVAAVGSAVNVWLAWNVAADVQAFVSAPGTNHGWQVRDAGEDANSNPPGGTLSAKEDPVTTQRPRLTIIYIG
jgi:hypothetical protein